ncbi:MAG: hypothetical protein RL199_790 [Pseudomonadota bacterium]|jgi:uncharacterized protein (UPF0276 family)
MSFLDRVRKLPRLGIGVSTEYGARSTPGALDPLELRARHPHFAAFLEVGLETAKGLDDDTRAWALKRLPTTYHFLDVNLDEPEDFDEAWLNDVRSAVRALRPAWLCGDAGLWHFGPRERGHMLLLPPVLTADAVGPMAAGIVRLREATRLEVLPENPPGHAFLGDLHLLDFFGRLAEAADTGLLLDCAHLAIYQQLTGRQPLDGLDGFPLDRVVELHVAGATRHEHEGLALLEDSHTPEPAEETWRIFDHVAARAKNLKAVVFECEKNPLDECLPGFARIQQGWRKA